MLKTLCRALGPFVEAQKVPRDDGLEAILFLQPSGVEWSDEPVTLGYAEPTNDGRFEVNIMCGRILVVRPNLDVAMGLAAYALTRLSVDKDREKQSMLFLLPPADPIVASVELLQPHPEVSYADQEAP